MYNYCDHINIYPSLAIRYGNFLGKCKDISIERTDTNYIYNGRCAYVCQSVCRQPELTATKLREIDRHPRKALGWVSHPRKALGWVSHPRKALGWVWKQFSNCDDRSTLRK